MSDPAHTALPTAETSRAWQRMGYWNDRELDAENILAMLVARAAHEYWHRRYKHLAAKEQS